MLPIIIGLVISVSLKESEVGEAALQLQFSEKRVASLETHVGSLNGSIKRLEQELEASAKVLRHFLTRRAFIFRSQYRMSL